MRGNIYIYNLKQKVQYSLSAFGQEGRSKNEANVKGVVEGKQRGCRWQRQRKQSRIQAWIAGSLNACVVASAWSDARIYQRLRNSPLPHGNLPFKNISSIQEMNKQPTKSWDEFLSLSIYAGVGASRGDVILSQVQLFTTLCTVAHHAPLSTGKNTAAVLPL